MLKQRLLTALIGLPVLLYLIANGSRFVALGIFAAFVIVATYEFAHILLPRLVESFESIEQNSGDIPVASNPHQFHSLFGLGLCIFLAVAVFLTAAHFDPQSWQVVFITGVALVITYGMLSVPNHATAIGQTLGFLIAICYGSLPWVAMWKLYELGPNGRYIILLMAIVWSGDTGGYFGGRFFGRHKLAPRISPKKTWEGSISGIVLSIVGGLATRAVYGPELGSVELILAVSLLGGMFGQMGDLVESVFKRFAGVKDSGKFFPGHGGFLDRSDALLMAGPIVWFVLYYANP
jgi:phosphatidate cytidylyltransferase